MWIEQLLTLLKKNSIEEAIALKAKYIPKRLFKYREVNETSLQNLRDNTVWVCDPNCFNDPYDSGLFFYPEILYSRILSEKFPTVDDRIKLTSYFTEEQVELIKKASNPIEMIIEFIHTKGEGKFDREIFRKVFQQKAEEAIAKLNSAIKDSLKVCSFSERNNSILMWSHYARQHSGICIEYNFKQFSEDNIIFDALYPIIYSDSHYDATDFIANKSECFPLIASLYKAKDWKYEKEWRLTFPGGMLKKNQSLIVPTPRAIYLGIRISTKDKNEVIEIAREKDIKIYNVKLTPYSFNLMFEEIIVK